MRCIESEPAPTVKVYDMNLLIHEPGIEYPREKGRGEWRLHSMET